MAHSDTTFEKYHRFPSTSEAVQTHLQIQQVAKERYFTNEQDIRILKEWPLAMDTTPTTRLCELIAIKYNISIEVANKFMIIGEPKKERLTVKHSLEHVHKTRLCGYSDNLLQDNALK